MDNYNEKNTFISKKLTIEHNVYNKKLSIFIEEKYIDIVLYHNQNTIEFRLNINDFKNFISNINNII